MSSLLLGTLWAEMAVVGFAIETPLFQQHPRSSTRHAATAQCAMWCCAHVCVLCAVCASVCYVCVVLCVCVCVWCAACACASLCACMCVQHRPCTGCPRPMQSRCGGRTRRRFGRSRCTVESTPLLKRWWKGGLTGAFLSEVCSSHQAFVHSVQVQHSEEGLWLEPVRALEVCRQADTCQHAAATAATAAAATAATAATTTCSNMQQQQQQQRQQHNTTHNTSQQQHHDTTTTQAGVSMPRSACVVRIERGSSHRPSQPRECSTKEMTCR